MIELARILNADLRGTMKAGTFDRGSRGRGAKPPVNIGESLLKNAAKNGLTVFWGVITELR